MPRSAKPSIVPPPRDPLTVDGYRSEVARQRTKYRWHYVLRWLLGWPKIAFVLNEPQAGWYLVRCDTRSGLCFSIGPCNSKAQAREVSKEWLGEKYFVTSELVLLWEEPTCNRDRGHRRFARPWYRVPARQATEGIVEVIRANPGLSSEELAAKLSAAAGADFDDWLMRLAPWHGLGQDEQGRWWHNEVSEEARAQIERGLQAAASLDARTSSKNHVERPEPRR